MRKIFTSLCLALAVGLTATAQSGSYQIPNSDFNNWAADNEPGNGWNSFPSATGSMSGMGIGSSPKPSKDTGRSGAANDYSCKLYSNSIMGVKANGNLTTGRINMGHMKPADASNHNFTDRSASTHSLRFAGRPDAVEFYAKFTPGSGNDRGRGQFILHGDVDYKDPEDASQASYKVGIASVEVPASADWTYFSGKFTYLTEQPATQYMLASFTTNPTPGGSKDDYLWIDDVKLIYYHSLTALSYEGATLNFNENTLNYDLSSVAYEESKLSYTKKGAGATVETSFDTNTNVLTINVKGNDYAENAQSITTYTIQFGGGVTPPVVEPDTELPLGAKVTSLDNIDMEKTYVLYNPTFTAYAIYNSTYSTYQVWTAGMIGGDADHQLKSDNYAGALNVMDAGSSWMVMKKDGNTYLYNMGAQKYLTTPGYNGESGACTFSEAQVALQVVALSDNRFAFSATGSENDYMCAAPQMDFPISIWTSGDSGSCWELYENPNIEADLSLLNNVTGIDSVSATTNAPAGIYTVSGMKLNATDPKELPAGLYIVNGKKTLIRK